MIKTRKHIILPLFLLLSGNSLSLLGDDVTQQKFDTALPQEEKSVKKTRKKRMRQKAEKQEKTKKIVTYKDMGYQQLIVAKDAQKAKGNIPALIKYLEQLLKLCTDVTAIAEHLLELADTFFIDGQFKKSARIYTEYCALYPGNQKQEYALYKGIMSTFACILSVDRDQSITEETLALIDTFLSQEHFATYREDVVKIQVQCQEQLAASECSVCNFYLNRGNLRAAEKRLTRLRTIWLPKIPTLEPQLIALEAQIVQEKEARELLAKKNTELAQNTQNKRMTNRF